ncbi:hypothetical protein NE237_021608 [Protea cynaroides]|uniref:Cytochrome P450 n=1 Tax=Protea cynaroides TaxID=273540 RepID=A0A9Q0K513_9MAGN|nr:hypothetical protein NE237_021608 [Protea cynaroides]
MEQIWFSLPLFLLVLFFFSTKLLLQKKSSNHLNLPPSPLGARPIIGHLHLMKNPLLHRTLHKLAEQYGSIFCLQLGTRSVVVVTSLSAIEECFTKNDIIFANRPQLLTGKYLSYNHTTIGSAPYGPYWSNLRHFSALRIFSTRRLNMSSSIREDEVHMMVQKLFKDIISSCQSFKKVKLKSRLSELPFNIIMRILAGKRYYGEEAADWEEAKRFRDIINEVFGFGSASNLGDFLPFLRWIDFTGVEKRLLGLKKKTDAFMQGLIEEHRNNERDVETAIDAFLALQKSEPDYYTDEVIKGTILNLIIAGTHTSATAMEWTMSLLLNHPEKLHKAKAEIEANVGFNRMVEESDLPNLNYLQCIINETFRLYPALPLLVPHKSSEDCTIGGFDVPRGTFLFVNAWAVHRDPKLWVDATTFKPERFEGVADPKSIGLIPFGIGRRACPAIGLANRVMELALAALIQCFEWERVGKEMVDMTEGKGLTMPRANPLEALCKANPYMVNINSQL